MNVTGIPPTRQPAVKPRRRAIYQAPTRRPDTPTAAQPDPGRPLAKRLIATARKEWGIAPWFDGPARWLAKAGDTVVHAVPTNQAGTLTLCGVGNWKRPPVEATAAQFNCLWCACRLVEPPTGGAGVKPAKAAEAAR